MVAWPGCRWVPVMEPEADLEVRSLDPPPLAASAGFFPARSTTCDLLMEGECGDLRSCATSDPMENVGDNGCLLALFCSPALGEVTTDTAADTVDEEPGLALVGVAAVSLETTGQATTRVGTRYCEEPAGGGDPEA